MLHGFILLILQVRKLSHREVMWRIALDLTCCPSWSHTWMDGLTWEGCNGMCVFGAFPPWFSALGRVVLPVAGPAILLIFPTS